VAFYARELELQRTEAQLFDAYVGPGLHVLDLGVGAGRTTPRLARDAAYYLGVDYAEAMVRHCQQTFPSLRFETLDATDLRGLATASFDRVVFSFNGIDSIPSGAARARCLAECARVLRPGGVLLLSVHNAGYLVYRPVLAGTRGLRRVWRVLYAAGHTLRLWLSRWPRRAYWRGAGFLPDPGTHAGLPIYVARPEHVRDELRHAGFEVERVLPAPDPEPCADICVAWYYYAARKAGADPQP
jgi:SAM-dependent methyltransferase